MDGKTTITFVPSSTSAKRDSPIQMRPAQSENNDRIPRRDLA